MSWRGDARLESDMDGCFDRFPGRNFQVGDLSGGQSVRAGVGFHECLLVDVVIVELQRTGAGGKMADLG